ncbi:LppP/LprE family lipoprotein [Tsukamurella sp. 1534]|uniref:LppP/LprE family lipoprotein n=1 Tax=Tsukamurella sp. 1534 TaxID=1151061 RepID=UPI00030DC7B3|nr:LppP/LprE family lipoprotein [Tsukamurella sp. 1534]
MARSSGILALVSVALLVGACGNGGTTDGAPSTFSSPETTARPGTGASGTGTAASGATADERPASAGSGKCLDLASPVVTDAVAKLPSFRGVGYTALRGTDAREGACPELMWAQAYLRGGTGSSPEWVLFFDRRGYLGTATDRYVSFTSVTGNAGDTVSVQYRWLRPGDTTAGVSGGPVTVNYSLIGRTVTPDRDVPPEVFDGGASPTATTTTTARPASHCPEATPETLRSNAESNWGDRIAKPFTVDDVRCADEWATARIPARDAYPQNARLLFRYTGGGWSGVAFGSGFSCTEKGVPAATAEKLGCS